MTLIEELPTTDVGESEETCKLGGPDGDDNHSFKDGTPLLSFCTCCRWQIIKKVTPNRIICMDINGHSQAFEKD